MLSRLYPIERMRTFDRFNTMMEDLFGDGNGMSNWMPAVDVKETENEVHFLCDLPGIDEKDIDIEVIGDRLTISGKREFKKEEKKENFVRIERRYGTFLRTFTLDAPVKPEDVKADFKDGILLIAVPKAPLMKRQKVLIHHK
ncbi:MAG: Spore protein SP21 [Fimbriimonadaceae bacterium]|nr:Spore protein SP21 [Fimbriimonadaceae bacterium]